jgi:AcrR family transcriptional regulator
MHVVNLKAMLHTVKQFRFCTAQEKRPTMNPQTDKIASGRKYRGISNTERIAERRQKLIDAGLNCFAQEGFHQSTVRGICTSAWLTERYFYESFSNMEDLFQAVYLQVSGQVRQAVLASIETLETSDVRVFSRAAMTAFFRCIQAQPQSATILFHEALSISRQTTELAMSTLNSFVDLLIALGQPAFMKQAGVRIEPGLISSALVGGIMHMAVRWAMDGFVTPVDEVVDNAALIFAGVFGAQL